MPHRSRESVNFGVAGGSDRNASAREANRPNESALGVVLEVRLYVTRDGRKHSRRTRGDLEPHPSADDMWQRIRPLYTFRHFDPAPVFFNNIHECQRCLSGLQVSVSDPTPLPKPTRVSCDCRTRKVVSCAAIPRSHTSERFYPRLTLQRCIPGPAKRCERCTALRIKDCVYEQVKKRGVGKTLRMGEACKRCRSATPTPSPTDFE